MSSLFKLEKKKATCQEIADQVSQHSNQSLNRFINSSGWDSRALFTHVAQSTSVLFEDYSPERSNESLCLDKTALLIDEVGFRKKGNESVGVAQQYLGCLGKTDNGQVMVAAGLSKGKLFSPIDMRLFMPKKWQADTFRRKKCGVPEDWAHQSKPEIAKQIIHEAVQRGVAFDYVNFDALYDMSFDLITYLYAEKIDFIGDIRSDCKLFFDHSKSESCKVADLVSSLDLKKDFLPLRVRESSRGHVKASFYWCDAQIKCTKTEKLIDLKLLVRKDQDGKLKYSITNMHLDTIEELAQKQAQRIFIEQLFREAKNLVGLGDYQGRSWTGIHNHIALSCYAMYIVLKLKINYSNHHFSAKTICDCICLFIEYKAKTLEEALNVILQNHSRIKTQEIRDKINKHPT